MKRTHLPILAIMMTAALFVGTGLSACSPAGGGTCGGGSATMSNIPTDMPSSEIDIPGNAIGTTNGDTITAPEGATGLSSNPIDMPNAELKLPSSNAIETLSSTEAAETPSETNLSSGAAEVSESAIGLPSNPIDMPVVPMQEQTVSTTPVKQQVAAAKPAAPSKPSRPSKSTKSKKKHTKSSKPKQEQAEIAKPAEKADNAPVSTSAKVANPDLNASELPDPQIAEMADEGSTPIVRKKGGVTVCMILPGQTYSDMDITGDGKNDTISIPARNEDDSSISRPYVEVNGTKVTPSTSKGANGDQVVGFYAYAISTGSDQTLVLCGYTDTYDFAIGDAVTFKANGAFETKSMFLGVGGTANHFCYHYTIQSITPGPDGKVTVTAATMCNATGYTLLASEYKVQSGTLVSAGDEMGIAVNSANGDELLTVKTKLTVYSATSCETKAFELNAGEKATITSANFNGKVLAFQVETKSGQSGWISIPRDKKSSLFEETDFND